MENTVTKKDEAYAEEVIVDISVNDITLPIVTKRYYAEGKAKYYLFNKILIWKK